MRMNRRRMRRRRKMTMRRRRRWWWRGAGAMPGAQPSDAAGEVPVS
jgi:hypothetical protein